MSALRLLLVDDEAPARARLRTLLADIAADDVACAGWQVVGEAGDGVDALAAIAALAPDIVLLDIQMPGLNGLELAAALGAQPAPPAVVFISAFEAHALAAFEVRAFDYLLKPVRAQRLKDAILHVLSLRKAAAQDTAALPQRRHFSVQERDRVVLVPVNEVLYLKAQQKYITMHTAARDYLIEESLASLEDELADAFVRVHRNALVARAAICGVERSSNAIGPDGEKGQEVWQVMLRDTDERLPISRRQWPVIKALVR